MDVDQVAELARELDLLNRRLRDLGPARLAAPGQAGAVADDARTLAQRLADAAAELLGEDPREVPRLGDHAVADQVAVVGRELLEALAGRHAIQQAAAIRRDVQALRGSLP